MTKFIDITRPITADTLLHPGDPPFMHSFYTKIGEGKDYNLSIITMGIHTGTHFDFPRHFVKDGATVEDLGPERFIVTAHVVDCGEADAVTPDHLSHLLIQPNDAVLLKTRNGRLPHDKMRPGWTYITQEAAQACVKAGVGMVGMDYVEVEQGVDEHSYPVHETLLGAGVLLLENIDLRQAAAGTYRLYCLPLLLPGLEGSPCRAVLEVLTPPA